MSVYGNPVLPGGGGVQLLTRQAWNALSTAQKQALGLTAIQDAVSGFDRGELVYGGDYIPFEQLLEVCQTQYASGATTYTAERAMRVLAVNSNTHRNTDAAACTAGITTTGTVVATDTKTCTTAAGNSSTAGQVTFSVIDLDEGDTVVFSNNTVSETMQFHLLFEVDFGDLDYLYWDIWPDKKSNNTRTVALDASKSYAAFSIQISKNTNSQNIGTEVSPYTVKFNYQGTSTKNYAYTMALIVGESSVTLTNAYVENYIGNMMIVYEVMSAAENTCA